MTPKILVACPTHESKEYCFDLWIRAVDALEAEHDTLVVDNSPSPVFAAKWYARVPIVHLDLGDEPKHRRIALSMEYIREYFTRGPYAVWLNIESDVIVPPQTASFMLGRFEGVDWLNLPYPYRNKRDIETGFGCSMFSRRLMEAESFADAPPDYSTDAWFWDKCRPKWSINWVRDSAIKIQHLSNER